LEGNLLLVIPDPPLVFVEKRVEGSEVGCQIGEELVVIVN